MVIKGQIEIIGIIVCHGIKDAVSTAKNRNFFQERLYTFTDMYKRANENDAI